MIAIIGGVAGFIGAIISAMLVWRWLDARAVGHVWRELGAYPAVNTGTFALSMLDGLPEAAQQYFRYTIKPGTPLYTAVELEMTGELGFGDKADPKYAPMRAKQILASPFGLVWKLNCGAVSGSDAATPSRSWTRFWLFNVIPIVRIGGNADHLQSAFGRVIAESAFWAPASLLPNEYVQWEQLAPSTARATVTQGDFVQSIEITMREDGQPISVKINRWSNANVDKEYRSQPFGGYLSEYREFNGYRLPTNVVGGNHIGTDDYFPFYKARIIDLCWLTGPE